MTGKQKGSVDDGEFAAITALEISGFRGFADTSSLQVASPTGEPGSGLTIVVGANGAGKSTVLESFHLLQRASSETEFLSSWRNASAKGRVHIKFTDASGRISSLGNGPGRGGKVRWHEHEIRRSRDSVFIVPSRRTIYETSFQNHETGRGDHIQGYQLGAMRRFQIQFGGRLTRMHAHHDDVDLILERVLGVAPNWEIEPSENGNSCLRIYTGTGAHSIDGLGEGMISLLFIADALYDSNAGDVIVLDEPELSLHPPVQRRLAALLAEYAADRQIIYATHSPYFVDWQSILYGANIARVFDQGDGSQIANLKRETVDRVRHLVSDYRNPHILGTDARELFFLGENVILVEGQEDVIGLRRMAEQLHVPIAGEFYGWGVGGAGNMRCVASILRDLAFRRVAGVLDADQMALGKRLTEEFPEFVFIISPSEDIRQKPAQPEYPGKAGLLDEKWAVPAERESDAISLLTQVNAVFRKP
jgi:predicted ATPase